MFCAEWEQIYVARGCQALIDFGVGLGPTLICLAQLLASSYATAGEKEDASELRRLVLELQKQNSELSRRLDLLERKAPGQRTRPSQEHVVSTPDAVPAKTPRVVTSSSGAAPSPGIWRASTHISEVETDTQTPLEARVKNLEIGQAAQEHATRQIIQDTLSKAGPKINSYISLSGVAEYQFSQFRDFVPEVDAQHPFGKLGPENQDLTLSSWELDFDVKVSDWLKGSLVLNNGNIFQGLGSSAQLAAITGTTAAVDRVRA